MILFAGVVVDEDLPVLLGFGLESKTRQAFFVLVVGINTAFFDVEEHCGFFAFLIIWEDADYTFLFDDKNAVGSLPGMCHHNWTTEIEIRECSLY